MKNRIILLCLSLIWILQSAYSKDYKGASRAPAYPLITLDPYISAWSVSDTLYHSTIRHWSGKKFPLKGILMVDGQYYRFMGKAEDDWQDLVELLKVNEPETSFTNECPSSLWNTLQYDDTQWEKAGGPMANQECPIIKQFGIQARIISGSGENLPRTATSLRTLFSSSLPLINPLSFI